MIIFFKMELSQGEVLAEKYLSDSDIMQIENGLID